MTDKLLPVIIFITIYAKSSYSHPNRVKNNYNINHNVNSLWRSIDIRNSVRKIGQTSTTPVWANYQNLIKKQTASDFNSRSSESSGDGRSIRPRGFVDSFLDFITGGFLYSFFESEKKLKYRKNKRIKRPPYHYTSEEYEFDPLETFFDGLDNAFGSKEAVTPIVYASKLPSTQTEYYDDESASVEDYSTEYSQEDSSTEYIQDDTSTEYVEDDVYASGEQNTSTDDYTTSHEVSHFTTEQSQEIINDKDIFYSTNSITPIKTTTAPKPKPTSQTTSTTTEKPVRTTHPSIIKPTRKIFTRLTTNSPIRRKVIRKPYQPIRHKNYRLPEKNTHSKEIVMFGKQDCKNVTSTTAAPQTAWLSNIFNSDLWSDRDPDATPDPYSAITTTKATGGWLDIFGNDDDADDENYPEEQVQKPSTGSWFSQIFDDDEEITTTPSTTTTTSPPPTNPPQSTWFNNFLNYEEDDGAYSETHNQSHKVKKGNKKSYDGFQLFRIITKGATGIKNLMSIKDEMDDNGLMWWSMPSLNRPADLLVAPNMVQELKDYLEGDDLKYEVLIHDLKKAIIHENPKLSKTQRLELERQRGHPLTWRRYHRFSDILRYMEYLSLKYPHLVNLIPLGRSSEGLPIVVAKVSYLEQNDSNDSINEIHPNYKKWILKSNLKPAIWIDAGMHAREWIAPAVASWFLHALVEGEKGGGADLDILKIADWYILPVSNPDGYEYSHTKDRLWSKTRSKHPPNENNLQNWLPWNWVTQNCVGVDANRNWDYHWNEKGASDNPCSDAFAGPYAFSEPETKVISTFLVDNRDRIKLYLTLQSYSQMWMMPMTHSGVTFIDEIDVMEMGKLAVRVLSDTSGTKYDIGTTADILQPITGTSFDWAKGVAGIKYSYGVKLRDAKGPHGFLLPGSEIVPTGKEVWEAIKVMAYNLS